MNDCGVAREMMKRVKYNFHVIANNLIKLGFEFERSPQVLVPASSTASDYIYTGFPPEYEEMNAEVIKGVIFF